MAQTWSESSLEVAGGQVELLTGGSGEPLIILHHDIGNPGWLPFYEALAQQFTVYVPSHPGYGKSDRLDWMRNVRDLAIVHQWLLKENFRINCDTCMSPSFCYWHVTRKATPNVKGLSITSGSQSPSIK